MLLTAGIAAVAIVALLLLHRAYVQRADARAERNDARKEAATVYEWATAQQRQAASADQAAKAAAEERDALSVRLVSAEEALRATPQKPPLAPEQLKELQAAPKCSHCGGIHTITCPRVRRLRFRPGGEPFEVEYFRDDEWPKDHVVFLDDILEQAGDQAVSEQTEGA